MAQNPVKNVIVAFGVLSAMFTIWQIIEGERAKKSAGVEHNAILEALKRIERKLK